MDNALVESEFIRERIKYSNLKDHVAGKKLVLFGVGLTCSQCINRINGIMPISYICDNDNSKHEGQFYGIKIKTPDVLKSEDASNLVVIITCWPDFYKEIVLQLLSMGIGNILFHFHLLDGPTCVHSQVKVPNIGCYGDAEDWAIDILDTRFLTKIANLFNIIEDTGDSKRFLQHVIKNRISCERSVINSDYLSRRRYPEYFSYEVFRNFNNNEIIVDGGLLDGKNFRHFHSIFGDRLKKIYGFEPGKGEFEVVNAELKNMTVLDDSGKAKNIRELIDIIVYPYALSDAKRTLNFSGKVTSERSDSGYLVESRCIDEVVDPSDVITLLKLDIEGEEMAALRGAAKTITRHKPRLMICLYHNPDDLWDIPFYIKSLCPEYKLYLSPHYGIIHRLELHATV